MAAITAKHKEVLAEWRGLSSSARTCDALAKICEARGVKPDDLEDDLEDDERDVLLAVRMFPEEQTEPTAAATT